MNSLQPVIDNIASISSIAAVFKAEYDQEALVKLTETKHYQIPGVYVRSLFIPAGMALTGKIHNYHSIAILAQGRIRIVSGELTAVIEAPYIQTDGPGTMRLGYAETDCTFITVHRTDNTDIPTIEYELASDTLEEFEQKTQARLGDK